MMEIHPERSRRVEMTDPHKEDRERLRPIVGAILAAVLAFSLLLWWLPAKAEEIPVHVYERDGLSLRLMPGPCVDPVGSFIVAQALPMYAHKFRAIESVWPMQDGTRKPFGGCWAEISAEETGGETVIVLVFEDRSRYVVRKSDLVGKKPGA